MPAHSGLRIAALAFVVCSATRVAAVLPPDAHTRAAPEALTLRVEHSSVSEARGERRVAVDATVLSVERTGTGLRPGEAIRIRYAYDPEEVQREAEHIGRQGRPGPGVRAPPAVPPPGTTVRAYLRGASQRRARVYRPAAYHRSFEPVAVEPVAVDSRRYRLRRREGGDFVLARGEREWVVPRAWLIPPQAAEQAIGAYVSSFEYDGGVNAFQVDATRVGLHVCAYAIQDAGAAGAAAGRDALLVLDESRRELRPGGLQLGVSKGRGRIAGCPSAWTTHLWVADIEGDGDIDVGSITESIRCEAEYDAVEDIDRMVQRETRSALRWYVFDGEAWRRAPARDGDPLPAHAARLPLIGLEETPVELLRELRD